MQWSGRSAHASFECNGTSPEVSFHLFRRPLRVGCRMGRAIRWFAPPANFHDASGVQKVPYRL